MRGTLRFGARRISNKMARIKVNSRCNVCTDEHSKAYVRNDGTCAPEITVPEFRARLSIEDAQALGQALLDAVSIAQEHETRK